MAKRSSDPRVAYPEVKVRVWDLVRVVDICQYSGKIRFIEPQGINGTGDLCRVPPAAVHHGKARQSLGTAPCGDCSRVLRIEVRY